jgi:arsenate reductase (thioredoxin)
MENLKFNDYLELMANASSEKEKKTVNAKFEEYFNSLKKGDVASLLASKEHELRAELAFLKEQANTTIIHKKPTFLFIILFIVCSISAFGQSKKTKQNATKQKTILFVCEHGAGRSAIAATYFNTIAKRNGLNYRAIFRGIDPQEALGLSTKNGFIKDSIDVSNLIPTKIEKADFNKAYKVITLDCTLPNTFKNPDLQWTGIQMNGNYDISKSEIMPKVDSLVLGLSKIKR